MEQSVSVKSRAENRLVEASAYRLCVVRMRVQLAADIQDIAPLQELSDRSGSQPVVRRDGHDQLPIGSFVSGCPVLAVVAPVGIAVPVEKANERVVYLVNEPPCPIPPKRLEAFDSRAPDPSLA